MNFVGLPYFFLFALELLLFISCYPQTQSEHCFSIVNYSIEDGPESIRIANINQDNYPDLIVASIKSDNLTVLLNNGKGQFNEATGSPFFAGNVPQDISVGDFNNDSHMDLAIANHEVDYITVLEGDGEGGFRPMPGSPFSVQSKPHVHGIANGDFNADGLLDLVVDSWEDHKMEVLFGNEDKGFYTPGSLFDVGPIMTIPRFRVIDVNRDENPDILITSQGGKSVTIMFGDGKGDFAQAPYSPILVAGHVYSVAIKDINKDGVWDLIIPHTSGQDSTDFDGLAIFMGRENSTFKASDTHLSFNDHFFVNVGVGDVNADTWDDVILLNQKKHSLTIVWGSNKGLSEVSYPSVPVGRQPFGMDVGDLNQDGKVDIVTTSTVNNELLILLSLCE
ncbi:MAG: FG-GAP repeat domain-containing protein [Cyclobacteriaceae bacterium]